jgi:hypothetical protein
VTNSIIFDGLRHFIQENILKANDIAFVHDG